MTPEERDEAAGRQLEAVERRCADMVARLRPLERAVLYRLLYTLGEERMAGIDARIVKLARAEVAEP